MAIPPVLDLLITHNAIYISIEKLFVQGQEIVKFLNWIINEGKSIA